MQSTFHTRATRRSQRALRHWTFGVLSLLGGYSVTGHCELPTSVTEAIFPNMVKVRATHRTDERGFGLIMFEKDDYLYIITPRHVVEDKEEPDRPPAKSIWLGFYHTKTSIPAELVRRHSVHDIALLRAQKPADFSWNYSKLSAEVKKGDATRLLGYEWRWEIQPQTARQEVIYVGSADLEVRATVKVNMSGGLVVTDDGIVGMIIDNNQEDRKITAYRLEFLAEVVLGQWLEAQLADLAPRHDYPYVAVDANGFLSMLLTSFDEKNPTFGYGTGIGAEYIWSPKLGLRLAYYDGQVRSESEFALTNQSAKFRNDFKMGVIYFLYSFENKLSRTPYFREKAGTTIGYIGLGAGEHDPQLNVNKAGFMRLDAFPGFEGRYDDNFRVFTLGLKSEKRFGRSLSGGFDIGLVFTDTKYLGIDVDDPFSKNKSNDFMLNFNFYLSWSFGKAPIPVIKALY